MRPPFLGSYTESKFTAKAIAKLMGCSPSKAKRILKGIKDNFGEVNEDLVGSAIQEVRNQSEYRRIRKFLDE